MRWVSYCESNVGKVRKVNEDSMIDRADVGCWVVADGMGGHAAGDFASQTVTEAFAAGGFPEPLWEVVDDVEARIERANRVIWEESQQRGELVGTTVVALVARDRHCVACWIGDSRLYLFRAGRLDQITVDHTELQELIDLNDGRLPVQEGHASGEILTRAVGTDEYTHVDLEYVETRPGDFLLLCSDGLNKEVSDEEIGHLLGECEEPREAVQRLLGKALERDARDNVTVGVIQALA